MLIRVERFIFRVELVCINIITIKRAIILCKLWKNIKNNPPTCSYVVVVVMKVIDYNQMVARDFIKSVNEIQVWNKYS